MFDRTLQDLRFATRQLAQSMAAFRAGYGRVGVRRQGSASEPFSDQYVSGNCFSTFGISLLIADLAKMLVEGMASGPAGGLKGR
jgi:hypothetical protein